MATRIQWKARHTFWAVILVGIIAFMVGRRMMPRDEPQDLTQRNTATERSTSDESAGTIEIGPDGRIDTTAFEPALSVFGPAVELVGVRVGEPGESGQRPILVTVRDPRSGAEVEQRLGLVVATDDVTAELSWRGEDAGDGPVAARRLGWTRDTDAAEAGATVILGFEVADPSVATRSPGAAYELLAERLVRGSRGIVPNMAEINALTGGLGDPTFVLALRLSNSVEAE